MGLRSALLSCHVSPLRNKHYRLRAAFVMLVRSGKSECEQGKGRRCQSVQGASSLYRHDPLSQRLMQELLYSVASIVAFPRATA